MAIREFTDSSGVRWQVWKVQPSGGAAPAYTGPERRTENRPGAFPERRRNRGAGRSLLTSGMEKGWLCFECGDEKRRLSPVPAGWEECSEEELHRHCAAATPVRPRTEVAAPAEMP